MGGSVLCNAMIGPVNPKHFLKEDGEKIDKENVTEAEAEVAED